MIEPIVTYSLESWYPHQVTLQNNVERIKKFAAKLVTNNFTASYNTLLEKLNWKPLSQLVMEKRLQLASFMKQELFPTTYLP
jgi:hypothetical protein